MFFKNKKEINVASTDEKFITISYEGDFRFHLGDPSELCDYRYGLYLTSNRNGKVSFNLNGRDYSFKIDIFIVVDYYDTSNDRYMGAINFEVDDKVMKSLKKEILTKVKDRLIEVNAKEARELFKEHNKPFAINIQFEAKKSDILPK